MSMGREHEAVGPCNCVAERDGVNQTGVRFRPSRAFFVNLSNLAEKQGPIRLMKTATDCSFARTRMFPATAQPRQRIQRRRATSNKRSPRMLVPKASLA